MPRLLLIDDDAIFREVLATALVQAGHTVIEAKTGREGLAFFRRDPCDLVITDLVMPDCDGLEIIVTLRRERANVPVVAVSGGARNSHLYLETARKLGARRTLAKPFAAAALIQTIDELLAPPYGLPPDAPK